MPSEICRYQAMGSEYSIRVDREDAGTAKEFMPALNRLFAAVREETERMENCFSRFLSDSELTHLNANAGDFVEVSPLMKRLLDIAESMHRLTEGVFDPSRMLVFLASCGHANTYPSPSAPEEL